MKKTKSQAICIECGNKQKTTHHTCTNCGSHRVMLDQESKRYPGWSDVFKPVKPINDALIQRFICIANFHLQQYETDVKERLGKFLVKNRIFVLEPPYIHGISEKEELRRFDRLMAIKREFVLIAPLVNEYGMPYAFRAFFYTPVSPDTPILSVEFVLFAEEFFVPYMMAEIDKDHTIRVYASSSVYNVCNEDEALMIYDELSAALESIEYCVYFACLSINEIDRDTLH